MKKDVKQKSQATTTRNLLSFVLVIVILGSAAGFYYGLQVIKGYALEVTHTVADSNASTKNIDELERLKKQLADGQSLVSKADNLFSTPDSYQTQALKDISKYAGEAGVTISSIDSVGSSEGDSASSYSESITLQSPVSYAKLLKFLDAIEGNLPKMQITGITLARPATVSSDQVATDKITITVAVRQ